MGMNLQTCCHKHKVKVFHYRGKENLTMLPFYRKHYSCMREMADNVETFEDQIQEKDWMRPPNDYDTDEEIQELGEITEG